MLACADPVWSNPTAPQVINGAVSFQGLGTNQLKVVNSPSSIIHWQGFSIGAGQVTQFVQQSASSAVLNRVVGADISQIHGQLLSNGRVFLINPAGIIVGAGGVINTAGFVGSTLNMLDGDFLAGKLRFHGTTSSGSIVNDGWIKAEHGGNVMLIAPRIENGATGVIEAQGGQLVLAAGQKITIESPRLEGVQFEVQAPSDSVVNMGKLLADGGAVGVFAGTLRHSGDIRANALTRDEGGRIVLKALGDATVAAGSSMRASGGTGGNITVQSGDTTRVSGFIDVTGSTGRGGTVQLLGHRVGVGTGANVDASGETGGGTILVGGDYQGKNPDVGNAWRTTVASGTALRADAITSGDGGKVIVWSDDATRFNGFISARGGAQSGDGGLVETSGKNALAVGGGARVDAGAPVGRGGTWLLDPKNTRVQNGGSGNLNNFDDFTDLSGQDAVISPTAIGPGGSASVFLRADNDVTFVDNVNMAANRSLQVEAGRSILIQANITSVNSDLTFIANQNTGTGLNPANRDPGAAEIRMDSDTTVNAGAGSVFMRINPGTGHAGTSGDIIVHNVLGNDVSIIHTGPTAGGRILRAASDSLVTASNSIFMRLLAPGTGASIGTSADPIRISAPILQGSTEGGTGGIFIDSLGSLQIGGANNVEGNAGGLQTINGGPIRLTVNGTLTQEADPAGCGLVGSDSGPICAGPSPASGAGAADILTIRAIDMDIQMPLSGRQVILLPFAGGTVTPGSAGAGGSLHLSQAELNLIDTTALRIGEDASGNIAFASGVTAPGAASMEFRTGGGITSSGGPTDITAAPGSTLTLAANGSIGATGPGRIKTNAGTATVNATSTTGGVFVEQTVGDMEVARYNLASGAANAALEYATTDGNILLTGVTFTGTPNATLITGGANRNIVFSGNGNFAASSMTLSPTGSTLINSGTQTFNAAINTARPISVGGGTATFNRALTAGSTLAILSGTANFNASSTIAGVLSITGGTLHVLGGTLQANGGLPSNGGTIEIDAGATLGTSGNSLLNTGTIKGGGTINLAGATLTNNGIFAPGSSPGTFVIDGNFTQGSNGTLQIELGGTNQGVTYDLLRVSGAANLGGTLDVSLINGFAPTGADAFDVMTYASRAGDFSAVNVPAGSTLERSPQPTFYRLHTPLPPPQRQESSPDASNTILREQERMFFSLPQTELQEVGQVGVRVCGPGGEGDDLRKN